MATVQTRQQERALTPMESWLDPLSEFDRMRHTMDAMLTGLWPRRLLALSATPAVNMYRDNGNLIVEAAMPGLKKEDIKVHLKGDTLSIEGESKQEKKIEKDDYYFAEMHHGSFSRRVHIPIEVKATDIKASYAEGMLRLTLPMVTPPAEKAVQVKIK